MNKSILPPVTLLIGIGLVLPAGATPFPVDLFAPGDALVTRDPEGGLDWLDLTLTTGAESYLSVSTAVSSSWYLEGWRHATSEEVCGLVERNAGAPVPCPNDGTSSPASVDGAALLVGLLGPTGVGTADGIFFDGDSSDGFVGFAGIRLETPTVVIIAADGRAVAQSAGDDGHFLVRPIPEPSALLLCGVGSLLGVLSRGPAARWARRGSAPPR